MRYKDFPILSNDEYNLLNKHYSIQPTQNRKNLLLNLCSEIQSCLCFSYNNNLTLNKATTTQLNKMFNILEKLLNNICSQFNLELSPKQTFNSFNLFYFLQKLNKILTLIFNWHKDEQKEYYKILSEKSFYELMEAKNNIFSALENSKVDFYKYM